MEKFLNALFSMRAMAIAMIVFFVAIARATFIESEHGIQAAKFWIYNATWFEILLGFLCLNLIANIVRYKMWMREKVATLAFHLSFIVIIIGAGITRHFGFEGLMPIREGASSNFIYSADPYLWMKINDGKLQLTYDEKLFLSEINWNDFSIDLEFPNHKTPIEVEYVDFLPKHIDSLVINDSISGEALEIVTTGAEGRKSNFLPEDDVLILSATQIAYGDEKVNGINVYKKNGQLMMRPTVPVQFLPMEQMRAFRESGADVPDSLYKIVKVGEEAPFAMRTLYLMGGEQFVLNNVLQHAKKYKLPSGRKDVGSDYLIVRVSDGKESKTVMLEGGMGMIPTPEFFMLGGLTYQMEYGSKRIPVPFYVKCEDFMIERYPGSNVASSYASDLQILDTANNNFDKKRIYMNHVLDYEGYRFFQSGFDEDELGTRLSVNYDYWGTNITYIGYLLMGIGMVLSLFAPAGRFRYLIGRLKQSREKGSKLMSAMLILFSLSFTTTFAQDVQQQPVDEHAGHDHAQHDHDHDHEHQQMAPPEHKAHKVPHAYMSEEHSDELAKLLVQDFDGRIVPMHTVCDQLLRKLYRSNKYEGHNAVQTIISMHMYPDYWIDQKIIQVPAAVREKYGLDAYASFRELSDENYQFKWIGDYNFTMSKLEKDRGETEKKLIKLVEKHQVFLGLSQWGYMKLLPVKNDPGNMWYVPLSQELMVKDSTSSALVLQYLSAVHKASGDNNYRQAVMLLGDLMEFQREVAPASILPSESDVRIEISYNKMGIFKNAQYSYLLLGFALLVLFIVGIFTESPKKVKRQNLIRKIFVALLMVIFLYHGAGMGMRWYISGHVPWSNGYEAVIFIAWITMIAGLVFARFSPVILAAAALLAFFMLFVTEMNLLDPEITPLQPVLKSYWLMIHVAVITGSYGFLGLSFMLGIINLFLYIVRGKSTGEMLTQKMNQITHVSEMTMMIGLFMLTIGTFLGGVWANESWGRYWGWDPKETWALVSVLVYAIILHLRFIPGLKGKFLFNVVSVWGYSAILFTFFGVNFILVGLHSYAQGEGSVGLPPSVIITISCFIVFTGIAIFRNAQYKKHQRAQL
jgi:cytochrome c-type biogenesis protein CcsB